VRRATAGERKRIGIVGAGIAGLTAAAAALQRGFAVTLLEEKPSTVLLWRQADCDKRWLHPHVYDWPQQDSLQDDAKLPVMTWTAGTARGVVRFLRSNGRPLVKSCQPDTLDVEQRT
jgi:glycine/D-amino acid oxidase-like deaminating enzyme